MLKTTFHWSTRCLISFGMHGICSNFFFWLNKYNILVQNPVSLRVIVPTPIVISFLIKIICNLFLIGNSLKELPDSVCQMKSLRTLDISHNQIRSLPRRFCNIRTLEVSIAHHHRLNIKALSKFYGS